MLGGRAVKSQSERAEEFRALHTSGHILILPNAWDVASARIFEDAGFPAIATSSAALAVSLGYPDGEQIPKDEMFTVVKKIASRLTSPLSVDIESGFGATIGELSDTIRRVIAAGGVGINIEDISNFKSKTLFALENQVERIRTVRNLSNSLGIPLVINARTDAYRYAAGDEGSKLEDAIRRANAYAGADADCLYPMGLTDKSAITKFVRVVKKPVNIMARQGVPAIPELEKIGVKRLSLGPGPMYAAMGLLRKIAQELKRQGTYDALLTGTITFDELNGLAQPRESP
jgi:2-methylisocitrate lyase-like PEP mutase family enzyme